MQLRSLMTIGVLAALSDAARAGVITGQCLDSDGNPVKSALLVFKSNDGNGPPTVLGGSTDAQGNFTTTITPDGDYEMNVMPLAPPASVVVTKRIESLLVGPSTHHLGVIEMELGCDVTGRVINSAGTPLQQVQLDYVAGPDQQPLDFTNPDSDVAGHFRVAVPFGSVELRFEPGIVPYYGGPGTAGWSNTWLFGGPIDLGDIVLPDGFTATGKVVAAADGSAVEDAELNAFDRTAGKWIFVAKNRTDATGAFSVVLPIGTFDLQIVPDQGDQLSPKTIPNKKLPPALSLGTIRLDEGFEVTGRVRDTNNNKLEGARVDVYDSATGAAIPLANPFTDASGDWLAILPSGTFDFVLSASFDQPYGAVTLEDVVITDETDLNDVQLPDVPFFTLEGFGTPGRGGFIPSISGDGGTPRLGNLDFCALLDQARGGTFAIVTVWTVLPPGSGLGSFSRGGGGLSSDPGHATFFVPIDGPRGAAGQGSGRLQLPIEALQELVGVELRVRFEVHDPAARGGFAKSRTLLATIAQ